MSTLKAYYACQKSHEELKKAIHEEFDQGHLTVEGQVLRAPLYRLLDCLEDFGNIAWTQDIEGELREMEAQYRKEGQFYKHENC